MRRERTQCVVIGTPPGASAACVSAIMFADDDLMTLQHAVEMFQALPNAELAIVPGTSHFLTQEKPDLNRDRARPPHPGPGADGGRHPARTSNRPDELVDRSGRPAVAGPVGCAWPIHVLDDAALREHAARRRVAGAGVALRIRCWQGTAICRGNGPADQCECRGNGALAILRSRGWKLS